MNPRELAGLPPQVRHLVHAVNRYLDDHAESNPQRRQELWTGMHRACEAVWNRPLTWRDHLAHTIAHIKACARRPIGHTCTR